MNLRDLIEKNLWNIILTLMGGFMAYVIGTTNTAATINDLTKRVDSLESDRKATREFRACVIRHIDKIESQGVGGFPCELRSD